MRTWKIKESNGDMCLFDGPPLNEKETVAVIEKSAYDQAIKTLKEAVQPCGESRTDLIERSLRELGEL